uniref:mitogen-activated protein kinase kinase n=1 Tax=Acrobeloides nanus TaxID=290746 RepID=A0A914EGC3_9BILA
MFVQWLLMHHLINVEMDIVKKVYALAIKMVVIFMGPVFKGNVFIGVSCSVPNWIWDVPSGTLTLSQTNYSNWVKDETGLNGGCKCVADRNSSNEDHGWRIANCTNDLKYFACMKPATMVAVDVYSSRKLPIGEIKLCDFGESRLLDNSLASTQYVGTEAYWPPERLLNSDSKYDIRADIWSLGITLMEIAIGRLPYLPEISTTNCHESNPKNLGEQKSTHLKVMSILNSDTTSKLYEIIAREIQPGYSTYLCEFLTKCLQTVETRPKLEDLSELTFYLINNSKEQFEEAKEFLSKIKLINNSLIDSNTNININVPKTSHVNINIQITD